MTRPRLILRDGLTEWERLQSSERVRRLPRREMPPPRIVWPPPWWRGACVLLGLIGAGVLTWWVSR